MNRSTIRRLGHALLLGLVIPAMAGCLNTGRLGLGSAAPASQGVAALGDGLIGQATALKLSSEARGVALDAEFQALQFMPAGQAVPWKADDAEGTVTPTQLYRVGSQDCRGYSQTVTKDGRNAKIVGSACRSEDGLWRPIA